ncbi:hypothetical protein LCGC14_1194700 [marine sediment metagenome]|uniref:FCP1 homology domain-containing protein n=1 Tax=marine sediment metagenome TaxID=412755 RepID=A0A0F9M670_9ZZZZ
MRKRLFVDCDDTLIIYDNIACTWPEVPCEVHGHPFGVLRGETYKVNEPLAASIKRWAYDNPRALVVIWSGGGSQYARAIADIALPGVDVMTMIKDETSFHMVRSGDIVVDDMSLDVPTKVYQPREWEYNGSTTG